MPRGKGTQARGKRHTRVHTLCRRCGHKSYHIQNRRCAHCGFPDAKTRSYNWAQKTGQRYGEGFGRLKHKKVLNRRAKNGFRSNTFPKPKPRKVTA